MQTQKELTTYLTMRGTLHTPTLQRIFGFVNRADFVLPEEQDNAHSDEALPIGYEQTISQPTVVATMLELLQPQPGDRVLDVGCGTGWTTTLLAEAVQPGGHVWGVERVPELVDFAVTNIATYHIENAEVWHAGDTLGIPQHAPFDRILVSAAAKTVPDELLAQLADGGTLVLPVEDALWQIRKDASGALRIEKIGGFAFVPLKEN